MEILVVDDDIDCLESYGDALKLLGHKAVLCPSVSQALESFTPRKHPLVFSDIRMPKLTGVDLLKVLRSKPPSQRPDVILFTGYAEVETAIEAVRMGAFDYIRKPVVIDQIASVLKRWQRLHPNKSPTRTASGAESLFEKFKECVERRRLFKNPKLNLDQVAKYLGTNRNELSKAINLAHPGGFSKFLCDRRLQEFETLIESLKVELYTIQGIAEMAGFPSATTFRRCFQNRYGVSPKEWMNTR